MPGVEPTRGPRPDRYDAVVLAGGSGRRLGGVDKATIDVGGSTLLERALAAVDGADAIIVVGPDRDGLGDLAGRMTVTTENPPGGGPVAAVAAALPLVDAEIVVVLACDMPLLTAAAVRLLVSALRESEAALLVDADGRQQYLAGAYRRDALTDAIAHLRQVEGAAMRTVVSGLTVADVVTDPEFTLDADTWDDVERSRRLLEER